MLDFWELLASWGFRKELVELEPEDVEGGPQEEPEDVEGGKRLVIGAWAGSSSLYNPVRDIEYAKSVGLGRIDIIVNDHSKSRSPRRFDIRDAQKISTLAKMSEDAGIEVHVMSWIMPHLGYLKEAADVLFELHEKIGFESVMWDAEEPWTLAEGGMGYDEAADWLAQAFSERDFEMGVTGIRYAPTKKLRGLCKVCDYWTPQNYATRTSKADPSTVNDKGVATWTKKFGEPPRWVLGVAGYRQDGIKGHTPSSALTASLDGAAKHCDAAVIWSLSSLRKSNVLSQALRRYNAA